jgi:ubiquitin carboxyl-terminal hydrolase L5
MTSTIDLVGEPFAVIESDPGLFSTFIRSIGVQGCQVNELYSIEPWATDHLRPQGLIFCFLWRKDAHRPADFNDPDAERVWFANQLNDDSCASLALLNVLFNTHDIALGQKLRDFRADTEQMSSVVCYIRECCIYFAN